MKTIKNQNINTLGNMTIYECGTKSFQFDACDVLSYAFSNGYTVAVTVNGGGTTRGHISELYDESGVVNNMVFDHSDVHHICVSKNA